MFNKVLLIAFLLGILFTSDCISYTTNNLRGLKVSKNRIVNEHGESVHFNGVTRLGSEYGCVYFQRVFDGAISEDHIHSWNFNLVRIPLNEDCLLGTNEVNQAFSKDNYLDAIYDYVNLLNNQGMAVILCLQWTSNLTHVSKSSQPMPNKEHSTQAWKTLSQKFKDNDMVLFELFGEPSPYDGVWENENAWEAWKNGGFAPPPTNQSLIPSFSNFPWNSTNPNFYSYEAAGMQTLVDVVRENQAKNIIVLPGIQLASSVSKWLQYKPMDPLNNLVASVHVFDYSFCRSQGCWNEYYLPVSKEVPLIASEVGATDCSANFVIDFLLFALKNQIHTVLYGWVVGPCNTPSLINDYDGTPTSPYGEKIKEFISYTQTNDITTYPHSHTITIYQDAVGYEFYDQSTAIHNPSSIVISHTGNHAFSFYFKDLSQYVYLNCWGCIDTSLHKSFDFYYFGGFINPFLDYKIALLKKDTTRKDTFLSVGKKLTFTDFVTKDKDPNSAWLFVEVPLSKFELPEGKYHGILLSPVTLPKNEVFLDEFYLRDKNENTNSNTPTQINQNNNSNKNKDDDNKDSKSISSNTHLSSPTFTPLVGHGLFKNVTLWPPKKKNPTVAQSYYNASQSEPYTLKKLHFLWQAYLNHNNKYFTEWLEIWEVQTQLFYIPPYQSPRLPSFSVIMPCYNCAGTVALTLQSLEKSLNHLYDKWKNVTALSPYPAPKGEIIIVNDGSDDNSDQIFKEFISQKSAKQNTNAYAKYVEFVYVVKEVNSGYGEARNTAIANSKNEIILWLDSDDAYMEKHVYLILLVTAISKAPHVMTKLTVNEQIHPSHVWDLNGVNLLLKGIRREVLRLIPSLPDMGTTPQGSNVGGEDYVWVKALYQFFPDQLFIPVYTAVYQRRPGNYLDRQFEHFQQPSDVKKTGVFPMPEWQYYTQLIQGQKEKECFVDWKKAKSSMDDTKKALAAISKGTLNKRKYS